MNTLTDLRRTLDEHADAVVADPAAVARTAAVHHRVAAVRRRRRAVGTGGVALALVTVAAVVWPRGSSETATAPIVLGQRAPTTIGSLGYTYRTDGHGESFGRTGSVTVTASSKPQLFSWTTLGAEAVQVTLPDGNVVHSTRTAFHDFVVIPAGEHGRLTVHVADGRVGLASYAVTGAAPAEYTKAGVTYRRTVAGAPLIRARIGEPGHAVLRMSYVAPKGWTSLTVMCTHLPTGYVLNVSLNGEGRVSGDSCDSDGSFDPGSAGHYAHSTVHPSRPVQVRAWISAGHHSTEPVPATSVPGLRLGIGVYGPLPQERVGNTEVPSVFERYGHTWLLAGSRTSAGAPVELPAAPADRLAEVAWHTHGFTEVSFSAGPSSARTGENAGGGPGDLTDLWVPAGSPIRASLTRGTGSVGVAVYERVD